MKLKKLFYTFLAIYGAAKLIEEHGDNVAKWLEKKAAEIGRKAGEKYVNPDNSIYEFGTAYYSQMEEGDVYFVKMGDKNSFDLLAYTFGRNSDKDLHNFGVYECYILTARGD